MQSEHYKSLAQGIVSLFYPLVECALIDREGRIQEIFNSFSAIKEDQECDLKKCALNVAFSELLSMGRNVRSMIYPVYQNKKEMGYLRIRYDLTHFKNLQDQLAFLIETASDFHPPSAMDPWKQLIDQSIHVYLSENEVNLQAMSMKQKRELISSLRDKGLFDFKESSAYVASKLQISRATVYNYLKTTYEFKKIHVHQVDAFTNTKFGGNPAGVVLDAGRLDDATMRKIARELNLSETAFVMPSKKAAFQLRYFTPTGHEINFCGHSTVGALYMIAKEKRYGIEQAGLLSI